MVLLIEKAIVDDGLEDWKNVIPAPYDTNMVKACVQIFLIQRARFLAKKNEGFSDVGDFFPYAGDFLVTNISNLVDRTYVTNIDAA